MSNINKYLALYNNTNDSGRNGKAFECAIREYLSGKSVQAIKAQNKVDAYFSFKLDNGKRKQVTVEIKTACGEIEMASKSQYIIYCPDVCTTMNAEKQGFVFTREEWTAFINGYTGRGSFIRHSSRGHDHIQSFYSESRPKASKPIANYIWETCYGQPTVEQWKTEMRGL